MSLARKRGIFASVCVAVIGSASPSVLLADTCPWGGDNSQSIRCFDCMVRVWTPHGWKLVNACERRGYSRRDR